MNKKLMKIKYLNLGNAKPLIVAMALVTGLTFSNAWQAPGSNPVNNNTGAPINEGGVFQTKDGVLTVGALINTAYAPVVTYSPLTVGFISSDPSKSIYPQTNFYGEVNLFNLYDGQTTDQYRPICTNSSGEIKLCADDVSLTAIQSVYYTQTLTNSTTVVFPGGGISGAVSYSISPSVSCETNAAYNTSWSGGTTLTGSDSNYPVTFDDWGSYTLSMDCDNGKTYSVNIDVKGKIKPVHNSVQKFTFPSAKTIEVYATGGGAEAGGQNSSGCYGSTDGLSAFAHATSASTWSPNAMSGSNVGANYLSGANVAHAGSGYSPNNSGGSCFGKGGNVTLYGSSNTQLITTKSGAGSSGSNGGCPGSKLSCTPSTDDGAGGYGNRGGGGGAYTAVLYNISAGDNLFVYNGGSSGSGASAGRPANLTVEWK